MAYRTAPTAEGTDIVRVPRRKEEVLDLFDGQSPVHVEVDGVDDQVHLARWGGSVASQVSVWRNATPCRLQGARRYRNRNRYLCLLLEDVERLEDGAEGFGFEVLSDERRGKHALSLRGRRAEDG
jgi:hypothetical protein